MKSEEVLEVIAEGQGKEHPILFSAPMVRAILDKKKTQTRRMVKDTALDWLAPDMFTPEFVASPENNLCPYGKVGDVLWVRETWWKRPFLTPKDLKDGADTWPEFEYETEKIMAWDEAELKHYGWKRMPSIFMPKEACRIRLRIESIRIERLHDITEEDAASEGVSIDTFLDLTAKDNFKALWDKINGNWDSNPYVWVISFYRTVARKTSARTDL